MLPALRSGINAGGNETQRALMGTRGLGSIPGLCLQPQEAERAGPDGLVTGALASLSPHPLYTLWSFAPTCATCTPSPGERSALRIVPNCEHKYKTRAFATERPKHKP